MASKYPAELDTLSTSNVDATVSATTHPALHNDANDAINEIENVLGPRLNNIAWNVEAFGAVPDEVFTDGEATSASKAFKSATAKFVAGDVGKTIVILKAGPSLDQDHHTTIEAVVSGTEATLSNAAGRTQSSCRFYIGRGGDQTTVIQEAIDAAATAGGGKVFFPGQGYTITGLVLKHRVAIEGMGRNATMLHQMAQSNRPIVRNDTTTNNSAEFCAIRHLWLDGNRARQSNITTTLASKYTAGESVLKLTSGTEFLNGGGVVTIGTNRLTYQKKEGNELKGVVGGNEGTTDAEGAAAATVTQIKAVGIHLGLDPFNESGTLTEGFDPHHVVEHVQIKNCKGDSFQGWGQSDHRINYVHSRYTDEIGFRPSFDSNYVGCISEKAGRMGYFIRAADVKLEGCKAFFAGQSAATEGHGFMLEGPTTLEEGTTVLAACSVQDNKANGFLLRNAQRRVIQGSASSNGTSSAGTYCGVKLEGISSLNIIDVVCTERVTEPNSTQRNALEIASGECKGNQIRVSHGPTASATVGPAIRAGSVLTGGNNITINGMGGTATPAFAAELAVDPYVATTHIVGQLTGGITIKKPSNEHLGATLIFVFLQDGTGGRTITWNEAFSTSYANTGNTLGKKLIIEFVYNTVSSKWQQTFISQSVTAGTYWI